MTRRINSQDVPMYVWRHAMNQETLLSTRVTVEREVCPHKHPLTVDVLLEPILTGEGILYESHLRIFGSVGDPLFDEIWDRLSQQIMLPDPSLRDWSMLDEIGTTYFTARINVPPEEAHDAVMDFFAERHDLTKFRVYDRPKDMSYLKRDYAVLPHLLMVLRSTSRSKGEILRAVNASSFMRWLVVPYLDSIGKEIVNLLFEVIQDEGRWQEVMAYFGTSRRVRFAWEGEQG